MSKGKQAELAWLRYYCAIEGAPPLTTEGAPPESLPAVVAISSAGSKIRALKDGGAAKEAVDTAVAAQALLKKEHAAVIEAEVKRLLLPGGDEAAAKQLLCMLPPSRKKAMEKAAKKARAAREAPAAAAAAAARIVDVADPANRICNQRKIQHLLASSGTGTAFRYHPRLSAAAGLAEGDAAFLTEKWDGTTVQATRDFVAKRFDNFKAGDPRKHAAPEEQRYRLERLDWGDNAHREIKRAVAPHKGALGRLAPGLCAFFEAVGPKIQARYRHLPSSHGIRVFDFARDGRFVGWRETVSLAAEYGLPLVAYEEVPALSLGALLERLGQPNLTYAGADAALEGWVLRGAGAANAAAIAKVRVEDLEKLVGSAAGGGAARAGEQRK